MHVKLVQFSFYKDKVSILRNFKMLNWTKISMFEDFSQETKEVLANRKI